MVVSSLEKQQKQWCRRLSEELMWIRTAAKPILNSLKYAYISLSLEYFTHIL